MMLRFTTNLKRRITAVYKPNNRSPRLSSSRPQSRPRKLRILQSQFHDALSDTESEVAQSPQTRDSETEVDTTEVVSQSHQHATEQADQEERPSEEAAPATADENNAESPEPTEGQEPTASEDEDLGEQPEDPDTIRWNNYITFNSEDEGDYTEGPARIILTSDGVKTCAALLMTLPLSTSIQQAVTAQEHYSKVRRVAAEKIRLYADFNTELEDAVNNQNILILKEGGDEEKLQQLREKLHILELMQESHRVRQIQAEKEQKHAEQDYRQAQQAANDQLREAFEFAQLLQPDGDTPDSPIEPLDLQNEYQETTRQIQEMNGGCGAAASTLDTGREHMFAQQEPLTAEQQRQQEAIDAVWAAQQRYDEANAAFDRRTEDRKEDWQASVEAAERGKMPVDASPEEFDLRWVQKIQDLTRELITAESALSAAKAAAIQDGVDVPMSDQASGFVDDVGDGYRLSMEQAMIGAAPAPKINDWMNGIPEVASPSFNEQIEKADEWEADEVQISDSISVMADDAGVRKQIDKWRKVCGLE